jgi:hypothetical protein
MKTDRDYAKNTAVDDIWNAVSSARSANMSIQDFIVEVHISWEQTIQDEMDMCRSTFQKLRSVV